MRPRRGTMIGQLFQYPFMVHALEAGTVVAILAAAVGWFVVLRRQAFTGHTLSVMVFPGAAGAALAGLPTTLGYYLACLVTALALGRARRPQAGGYAGESATVGTVQAVGLAVGFLFLSLNHALLDGLETLLFGTFLGVSQGQVLALLIVALVSLVALGTLARPLLFATVDPVLARARGVPVGLLDGLFLLILALAVAATTQITGALLVFALLVAPAASAQLVTVRPLPGLLLSIAFALLIVWLALGVAYFSIYPIGFYATTFAFGIYVALRVGRFAFDRLRIAA